VCLRVREAQWPAGQKKQTGAAAAEAAIAVNPAATAAIAAVQVTAMTHRQGTESRMTTASTPQRSQMTTRHSSWPRARPRRRSSGCRRWRLSFLSVTWNSPNRKGSLEVYKRLNFLEVQIVEENMTSQAQQICSTERTDATGTGEEQTGPMLAPPGSQDPGAPEGQRRLAQAQAVALCWICAALLSSGS